MKLPQNKSLSGLSRTLRNNGTKAEAVLWKYIKNKQGYGFQFHRQKNIGQYIVDFYYMFAYNISGRDACVSEVKVDGTAYFLIGGK